MKKSTLCKCWEEIGPTVWPANWKRQTDRQTDRQADRQTDRQTDRQAGRQAGKQADRDDIFFHTYLYTHTHTWYSTPYLATRPDLAGGEEDVRDDGCRLVRVQRELVALHAAAAAAEAAAEAVVVQDVAHHAELDRGQLQGLLQHVLAGKEGEGEGEGRRKKSRLSVLFVANGRCRVGHTSSR